MNFEQRLAKRQKDDDLNLVSKEVWHQAKPVAFRKEEGIAAFRTNTKTQEGRINEALATNARFDPDNFNQMNMLSQSFHRG